MIMIIFDKPKLKEWEKTRYAVIIRKIISGIIKFNKDLSKMGNYINVELRIRFK